MVNSNRTPERALAFCAALAETANIGRACRAVGMGRTTAYEWYEGDPEFAEQWDRAMKIGITALEDEAKRRAFEGVDEPVIHQGQFQYLTEEKRRKNGRPVLDPQTKMPVMVPVYNEDGTRKVASVKKYSDSLAVVLLKAHGGEKYRDKSNVELNGSMEFSHLSDADLREQITSLEQQLATTAAATAVISPAAEDEAEPPA